MQESLLFLDVVCPACSKWVREKYESGQLVFDARECGLYGWYHPATGKVGVCFFALSDSTTELACTLAHEYRHSRQGILRGVQCEIAKTFGVDRTFELVEAEAYEFEERVRRAMRGER